MVLPRLIARLPIPLGNVFQMMHLPASSIAEATQSIANATSTLASATSNASRSLGSLPTASQAVDSGFLSSISHIMNTHRYSNIDGIFSYLASKWAIATFVIVSNNP